MWRRLLPRGLRGALSKEAAHVEPAPIARKPIGPLHDPDMTPDPAQEIVDQMGDKDEELVRLLNLVSHSQRRVDLDAAVVDTRQNVPDGSGDIHRSMFGSVQMFDEAGEYQSSTGTPIYPEWDTEEEETTFLNDSLPQMPLSLAQPTNPNLETGAGLLNIDQLLAFYTLRRLNPSRWDASTLAEEFLLPIESAEALCTNFTLPVIVPQTSEKSHNGDGYWNIPEEEEYFILGFNRRFSQITSNRPQTAEEPEVRPSQRTRRELDTSQF